MSLQQAWHGHKMCEMLCPAFLVGRRLSWQDPEWEGFGLWDYTIFGARSTSRDCVETVYSVSSVSTPWYMLSLFPDSLTGHNLPPCRTLLIKGSYHSSAPIHLCLSHSRTHPRSKVIWLTSSRSRFRRSLEEFNDDWLSTCAGHGRVAEILSRIDILSVSRLVWWL